MKRIRYVNNHGRLSSVRALTDSNGEQYQTFINEDGKSGGILHLTTNTIVRTVRGTSPHKVKIAIREALQQLGVIFEAESRSDRTIKTYFQGSEITSDDSPEGSEPGNQ
jgi:hypothetical protein